MTTHTRSENQTAISVSMTRELLAEVDERAKALGLNRSQYLAQLARADLRERRELTLREIPSSARVEALALAGAQLALNDATAAPATPAVAPTAPARYRKAGKRRSKT